MTCFGSWAYSALDIATDSAYPPETRPYSGTLYLTRGTEKAKVTFQRPLRGQLECTYPSQLRDTQLKTRYRIESYIQNQFSGRCPPRQDRQPSTNYAPSQGTPGPLTGQTLMWPLPSPPNRNLPYNRNEQNQPCIATIAPLLLLDSKLSTNPMERCRPSKITIPNQPTPGDQGVIIEQRNLTPCSKNSRKRNWTGSPHRSGSPNNGRLTWESRSIERYGPSKIKPDDQPIPGSQRVIIDRRILALYSENPRKRNWKGSPHSSGSPNNGRPTREVSSPSQRHPEKRTRVSNIYDNFIQIIGRFAKNVFKS
jgi:hypothetical protein